MIRDFHYSKGAREPALLVLGHALRGDIERARILQREYDREQRMAGLEGRQPAHNDYVRAWMAFARCELAAAGKTKPTKREFMRKLGLVRQGKRGNAPKFFAALATLARVQRHSANRAVHLQEEAKQRASAEMEQIRRPRKGGTSKYKTVEDHLARARSRLEMEAALQRAKSPADFERLGGVPSIEIDALAEADVLAFNRGMQALFLLDSWSPRTADLIHRSMVAYCVIDTVEALDAATQVEGDPERID